MGKIVNAVTMSLDGFMAGLEGDFDQLFKWFSSGDTEFTFPGNGMTIKVASASAQLFEEIICTTGAFVAGRRLFDLNNGWGGHHPLGVPVFVVTHNPPPEWPYDSPPFTFVNDGIASAIEKARQSAGELNVMVASGSIAHQCLKAGLLDEITIDLVPFLLGRGVRTFEYLGIEPIELERTRIIATPDITHLQFRVVK